MDFTRHLALRPKLRGRLLPVYRAWIRSLHLGPAIGAGPGPRSPFREPLLRLRARSRCGVGLVGLCSAARKAASAFLLSPSVQPERALRLATGLLRRVDGVDPMAVRVSGSEA